jgi:hypothetical protein
MRIGMEKNWIRNLGGKKFGSRIRDRHPVSATVINTVLIVTSNAVLGPRSVVYRRF